MKKSLLIFISIFAGLVLMGNLLGFCPAFILFYSPMISFSFTVFYIAVRVMGKRNADPWLRFSSVAFLISAISQMLSLFHFINSDMWMRLYTVPFDSYYKFLFSKLSFEFFVSIGLFLSTTVKKQLFIKKLLIPDYIAIAFSVGLILTFLETHLGKFQLIETSLNFSTSYTIMEVISLSLLAIALVLKVKDSYLFLPISFYLIGLTISIFEGTVINYQNFVLIYSLYSVGSIAFTSYVVRNKILYPYKKMVDLSKRFDSDIESLDEKIVATTHELEVEKDSLLKIVNAESIEDVRDALEVILKEIIGSDAKVAIFNGKELFYKSVPNLPDDINAYNGWNRFEFENWLVFYSKLESDEEKEISEVLKWMTLKVRELELIDNVKKINETLKSEMNFRNTLMRAISHELKTPLNVIFGNLQLMDLGVFGDVSKLKEPLERIKNAAENTKSLIESIMSFLNISSEEFKVNLKPAKFKDFKTLIETYEDLAKTKGLNFNFRFEGIEPFETDHMILSTIISNLLSNAIKYTDYGKVFGKLSVSKNVAEIVVEDTGGGIEEEDLPHIFDLFFKKGGEEFSHGIGLAVVKKLVELLNGEIRVESEVGKGTKFTVKLPRNYGSS